jgi:Ca2+-binding EF-hand superfamily protein
MGGVQSVVDGDILLRPEELDDLVESTGFTRAQIKRLYARFRKLDQTGSGGLAKDDILRIPELAMNPLNERILAMLFETYEGQEPMIFPEFLQRMALFNDTTSREAKVKAVFDMLDIDKDGRISKTEFISILRLLVGKNLTDEELDELADITLSASTNKGAMNILDSAATTATASYDGLTLDDFHRVFQKHDFDLLTLRSTFGGPANRAEFEDDDDDDDVF